MSLDDSKKKKKYTNIADRTFSSPFKARKFFDDEHRANIREQARLPKPPKYKKPKPLNLDIKKIKKLIENSKKKNK